MRVTVLCILAFAGATCALQIPSIPSPQSVIDAGSSILGNIPGIKGKDDSSSSSSSSEEDQQPSDIAKDLAERLVDDLENAAGGLGSIALLPLNIGTTVFESVSKEIRNFLGDVLHAKNMNPDGPTVFELAYDLAQTVVHDVEKVIGNLGSILMEPLKLEAELVKTIAHGVDQFLKHIQNQISGGLSAQHHRPTHRPKPTSSGQPSTTQHPKPTSSHGPQPTSSQRPQSTTTQGSRPTSSQGHSTPRPRPTRPQRPSAGPSMSNRLDGSSTLSPRPTRPVATVSKDSSVQVRIARDIDASFSTGISVDQVLSDGKVRNLGKALGSVDFHAIVKPIPQIQDLTPLDKLPALPGLASAIRRARDLVIHVIAAGAPTIEKAIQIALNAAIATANPAAVIVNLVNMIVQVYVFVAQTALVIPSVAAAVLKEAAIVAGSIVSSLLAVLSDKVADGVRALL